MNFALSALENAGNEERNCGKIEFYRNTIKA